MPTVPDICLICLRTDKTLKIINTKLSSFHEELCDITITDCTPQYCSECEYLLRKSYKFKLKCMRAMKIMTTWKKSKGNEKQQFTFLHTLLPQSSMGIWTSNNGDSFPNCPQDITKEMESNITQENLRETVDTEDVTDSQILLGNSFPKDNIKIESDEIQNGVAEDDSMKYLKDILAFKSEDPNNIEEILVKNSHSENDEKTNESLNDKGNDEIDDLLNDYSFDEDDDRELIYLKKKNVKKNKEKKTTRKRSIERSESDFDAKISKKRKSVVKKENDCKRIVAKKNGGRKEVAKKNVDSKKTRFHTTRGIIAELLLLDSEEKNDNNYDKEFKNCKKRPFSKERLKEELKTKFASCGELRTSDGTLIDKEFILNCLDDKATEYVMRQLYNAVYRKSCIKPKALKLFKCIQNKYKNEFESVFDIEYLNTTEKMLEEFEKRKTYESYITAEYKCEICFQGFKHEKKMQYHKKCHDENAGNVVCLICKARHRSQKCLVNHMKAHEAIYRCKLCPLITYYRTSMQNHYQQHKGVKFTCKQCNAIFGSVSAYRTHMSYRHARGHVCTACGRAFATRVGLLAHHTRDHLNEAPIPDGATSVKCGECALSFASTEAYNRHVRVTHKQVVRGRPPGTVVIRDESRPRKRPVIVCRVCNAEGSSWGWLSLHFSLEHPAADVAQVYADKHKHLCDICGKSFSTIYTLQAHLNVHTGSRPYSCDSCSASFHRSLSLRLHRLVHTPPNKPCSLCGKKFRSTSNLYNHMRTHVGDRRYKCDICGKGFLHRCSLNEHVRGVHNNIRRVRRRGLADAVEKGL